MVLQLHPGGNVVKVDGVVCMLLEPRHKQPTDGERGGLAWMMRHVHTTAERVCGVWEHVHLARVLETNVICLINAGCNCLQLGVIRRGETGSAPVGVQITLLPDAVSRDRLERKGGSRRVGDNADTLREMRSSIDLASEVTIPFRHEFFAILIRLIGRLHNIEDNTSREQVPRAYAELSEPVDGVQVDWGDA
jgi:hypothetical protein